MFIEISLCLFNGTVVGAGTEAGADLATDAGTDISVELLTLASAYVDLLQPTKAMLNKAAKSKIGFFIMYHSLFLELLNEISDNYTTYINKLKAILKKISFVSKFLLYICTQIIYNLSMYR